MPHRRIALPAALLVSLVSTLAQAASLECPGGGRLVGDGPPSADEQWCEAKDLFGGWSRSGPYRRWHPNGQIAIDGTFMDGRKHGVWKITTTTGAPLREEEYKFGRLIRTYTFEPAPTPRTAPGSSPPAAASAASAAPVEGAPIVAEWDPAEGWVEPAYGPRPFVHSVWGPEAGRANIGLGLRAIYYIPLLDFHAVYAAHEHVHLEARVASMGMFTTADLGARLKLFGDESFSMALRADMTGWLGLFGVNEVIMFGPTTGLSMSFGNEDVQVTMGMNVPMWVFFANNAGSVSFSDTVFAVTLRPHVNLEVLVSEDVSFYVSFEPFIGAYSTQGIGVETFIPFIAMGASF